MIDDIVIAKACAVLKFCFVKLLLFSELCLFLLWI